MTRYASEANEETTRTENLKAPPSKDANEKNDRPIKRNLLFEKAQRRFRGRRFQHIEEIIRTLLQEKDSVTILDAGGRADYWTLLHPELRGKVSVTLLNVGSELALYDADIKGLSIKRQAGDACHMPQYVDRHFDIVHSNSVIEHVGSYSKMLDFAREVRRVGRFYYVQTPNFWFPVDPHYGLPFVHWLPDPIRIGLFQKVRLGHAKKSDFEAAMRRGDATKIITSGMMRRLFPDAKIMKERFVLMTKSIMVIGGKA